MTTIKPSSHGIVVDHKESGVRYAVSDRNYNPTIHHKVRDLKPGETVLSFQPLSRTDLAGQTPTQTTSEAPATVAKTEGSSAEGTKGK